jgi:hypothetical protein
MIPRGGAIPFAAHGYFEAVFYQAFLVIMRSESRATIHLVNGVAAVMPGHIQRAYCQISFHAIANRGLPGLLVLFVDILIRPKHKVIVLVLLNPLAQCRQTHA